jgi:hypothetical protein
MHGKVLERKDPWDVPPSRDRQRYDSREALMQASDTWDARVGDELSVESHKLRGARRTGVIVEMLGTPEHRYYRVRWQDGRETLLHPGSDAVLHPKSQRRRSATGRARVKTPPKRPASTEGQSERRVPGLRASPGDRLVIKGHRLGEPTRDAEILEVLGREGGPPFRVRWWDTGREAVFFPGADAAVEHFVHDEHGEKAFRTGA